MNRLGSQSPNEARSAKTKTLRDITNGSVISRGYNLTCSLNATWDWISSAVATEFECDASDVHVIESDEGDMIGINGKPVAYIEGEYEPLWEMLQAAE